MEKLFINSLVKLFERDLNKLEEELKLYTDEALIWAVRGEIKNSAGNLCLHLCGNLQHFIGHILGHSGYKRNRDLEFSAKNIPVSSLLEQITTTRSAVLNTLNHLDPSILQSDYPENVFGYPMTHAYFIMHLESHLNYHLGQVNYHRRLIAES